MTDSIVELIKNIVQAEITKLHFFELGIVTSVFPHSEENDHHNYECNVKLKDKGVELRSVPIMAQQIGLVNPVRVNDLVVIGFLNGKNQIPFVCGRFYNDKDRPPLSEQEEIVYIPNYDENKDLRRFQTILPGNKVDLSVFDNALNIKVGRSFIRVSDNGTIEIETEKKENSHCKITLKEDEITIFSDKNMELNSNKDLRIKCNGDYSVQANSISLESKKDKIAINSNSSLELESKIALDLTSGSASFDYKSLNIKSATASIKIDGALTIDSNISSINTKGPSNITGAPIRLN